MASPFSTALRFLDRLSAGLHHRPRPRHVSVAVATVLVVVGVAVWQEQVGRHRQDMAACVVRGVASFKVMGSYPVVRVPPDAGRFARDVARDRCEVSTEAF